MARSHYVFDDGHLVAARWHEAGNAGSRSAMRDFALFADNRDGRVRLPFAITGLYRGRASVATDTRPFRSLSAQRMINIDTGCVPVAG
jgi:hypothetical protein